MSGRRRVLIVVDVQNEYLEGPLAVQYPPFTESLERIRSAVQTAVQHDVPVVLVEHENPAGAAAFAADSPGRAVVSRFAAEIDANWPRVVKRYASAFDATDLASVLAGLKVDTISLVGYMTNNCIIATAASAAPHGLTAEVLSDAVGAIDLSNDAGSVPAQQVHETLMTLLDSNFAAVADTSAWAQAVASDTPLPRSNLVASALAGRSRYQSR
ncbi:isochorismatase family protein [Nakamurella aerolata]|uniref:Isochorismatase family protein n=1 Tax=Nakamurella aerolata TaxID=1656892 RepID=A0A849A7T1_9ACTN|nr:isochorismatase family protein [Nakamurella aerolata]NNG35553.1 isochorismatase family protein [Nakamurella aerolata]